MTLKLDENQQKAIEHFEGPALVVAGPGSGKTAVIIERILNMIRENSINSHQILAVAFNRKAVREMEQRLSPKLAKLGVYPNYEKPEICTLHAFGRRIIVNNHGRLNFKKAPDTWRAFALEITIKGEVAKLNREKANTEVTIYKVSSKKTGRCYYIGQTTNLQRRKEEHLIESSNSHLRQVILAEGEESVAFIPIDSVEGRFADKHEAEWIEHYKSLTVFNSEFENEAVEEGIVGLPFIIYKIESKITGRCYVGYTTDPESIEQNFEHISNNALQEAIEDEGEEQFIFEILHKEVPVTEVAQCVADEIEAHKNRAVFNHSNPLSQRYSDRLLIEFFCDHFNICYEELLRRPSDIENFADKIKDFEKMASNIDKAKREFNLDFLNINSIDDIINAIISSIDDLVVRAFAENYEQKKRKANAIDFQDMIIYATYLLETHPDICKNYCERYQYVFVDEFQDISFADFRLIKLLPDNLFAVGDDDQAIYGFRGGDSKIMQDFQKREDVKKYEITRNYRSTSIIVEHSKTLMEHNLNRISKDLHAKNLATYPPIKTLETRTTETLERTFLREFLEPICQTQFIDDRVSIFENTLLEVDIETHTIGILARYRSEVEKLRKLLANDFKEIKGDNQRKEGDPFSFVGRGPGEIIEGGTIHSAKGKEYDKVILIHNTLEDKDFPFHDSDDINEDRRVFYVAMTRAKRELVILGGECQFVAEAGLSALPSKRNKRLEKVSRDLISTIMKRIDTARRQVDEISEAMQAILTSAFTKHVETAREAARKQHERELNRLRKNVPKAMGAAMDAAIQLKNKLPTDIKTANEVLLKDLIPLLDAFELQINNVPETVKIDNAPSNLAELAENFQRVQGQLLDYLENHGLKPIRASSGKIFDSTNHEEISPAIYSDDVPAGTVIREEQCGYLLHNRVVRKARVLISKGRDIWTPERLDWIVERYIDRLMSEFERKYQLANVDRTFVKLKMVQYLTELDGGLVGEIDSFAVMDKRPGRGPELYANYCVDPEKTHLCTDTFQDFWNCMWQVVEQSRKTPETKIALSLKPESFKDESVKSSTNKPIPILEIENEISDESPKLRVIKPMNKTVEAIPMPNESLFAPEVQGIPLDKSINLIVSEPVEEVIDTSLSVSTDFTESLDTYIKDLKPEILKTVEAQRDPLYEQTDLIVRESVKGIVNNRLPVPKGCLEIPDSQIQNLKPETLEISSSPREEVNNNPLPTAQKREDILKTHIQNLKPAILESDIASKHPIAVNNNAQKTLHKYDDILKEQIQNLKSEIPELTNPDSVTQEPALETEVAHETLINPSALPHPASSIITDNNAHEIREQDLSEDKTKNIKKSFGYYLRRGGRFAVEKIKATIFNKPNP